MHNQKENTKRITSEIVPAKQAMFPPKIADNINEKSLSQPAIYTRGGQNVMFSTF